MNEHRGTVSAEARWATPVEWRLRLVTVGNDIVQTPTPQELAECILAVATHRDRAALSVLFRHFGPKLKTYFLRGGATSSVAEDLVQETMLTLWRKAAYFDPARAGAATWLFTIARNLRIDHLRRQRDPKNLPHEPGETPPSIEDELLASERDDRVRKALAALSSEQLQIVRLSFYSDKSQSEIAGELGIPLGTVKSRTRLAFDRLRKLLDDDK